MIPLILCLYQFQTFDPTAWPSWLEYVAQVDRNRPQLVCAEESEEVWELEIWVRYGN